MTSTPAFKTGDWVLAYYPRYAANVPRRIKHVRLSRHGVWLFTADNGGHAHLRDAGPMHDGLYTALPDRAALGTDE